MVMMKGMVRLDRFSRDLLYGEWVIVDGGWRLVVVVVVVERIRGGGGGGGGRVRV